MGIKQLSQEWPFMFKETGMAAHFKVLTGIYVMECFLANIDKNTHLLMYFKSVNVPKTKCPGCPLIKFHTGKSQLDGCRGVIIQIVLLLLVHFGEKEVYVPLNWQDMSDPRGSSGKLATNTHHFVCGK